MLGALLNFIPNFLSGAIKMGETYIKNKAAKQAAADQRETTRVQAETRILEQAAEDKSQWQLIWAQGAQASWKDEFWTIVIAMPTILVFIPQMAPHIEAGFAILDTMPLWYKSALGVAIGAAFGVQQFKNWFRK